MQQPAFTEQEPEMQQAYQGRRVKNPYQGSLTPGSAAENEFVRERLPLVKSVVGRIAMTLPSHVDTDDLLSAGLVGLLNAVRQYDPNSGASFNSYARVRIRGAVFDELRKQDWVPRSVHAKAKKVQNVIQELEQAGGATPTDEEVAEALDLTMSEYEQLMNEIKPATFVCLDCVRSNEAEGGSMPGQYEAVADQRQENPREAVSRREVSRLIAERLEQLPEVQRKVLALYYFEGLRLREIAEAFGLTESRICQIHSKAILAIKSYLERHELNRF
ncbi:MAG: FliA/WhiG family RNA polymerase sigma factor [Verrucomicrobia bacterium]|nr:FliA/WhiG family RNA polymerase sigma factor [Verrucomicrobiota bacterium]MCF7707914.1 FliA/WhiG family RNA polymerase sigma factor [Verrucomicrobiota bacterium]